MGRKSREASVQIMDLDIEYYEGDENGRRTQQEIGNMLKIPRNTVQSIIRKYKMTGKVDNLPRGGRYSWSLGRHKLNQLIPLFNPAFNHILLGITNFVDPSSPKFSIILRDINITNLSFLILLKTRFKNGK